MTNNKLLIIFNVKSRTPVKTHKPTLNFSQDIAPFR